MGRDLFEGMTDRASTVRQSMSDGMDRATTALKSAPNIMPDIHLPEMPDVSHAFDDATTRLTELFDQQPLILGVVGLAIGAGLAGVVAVTQSEKELLGAASNGAVAKLHNSVDDVARKAQEIAKDAGTQAKDAGTEAIGALRQVGERATTAAKSALDKAR